MSYRDHAVPMRISQMVYALHCPFYKTPSLAEPHV